MPLTPEQQMEIDKALEKEVNEIDEIGDTVDVKTVADTPVETPSVETPKDPPDEDKSDDKPKEVITPPAVETPSVDDKDTTIAELRSYIDNLNKTVLDLKSGKGAESPKVEKPSPPPVEKPPVEQKQTLPVVEEFEYKDIDFVGDLNMDDVTADPKLFNQVINKAVKTGIDIALKTIPQHSVKQTLLAIPQVIQAQIKQQSYIDSMVNTFYQENEDLVSVKYTVGQVAESIAAEHPEYGIEQLFKEAGEKTRQILKLPAVKVKKETPKSEFENPALVSKTSKRETPAKVDALQAEIDEL
jgi:hypothetical protein